MAVGDVFNVKTRKGPILVGKIETGAVSVGAMVVAEGPGISNSVQVVGIEKFAQPGLEYAEAGDEEVAVEVVGITPEQARKCQLLTGRSSRHEERPQVAAPGPAELAAQVEALMASEYRQLVAPLAPKVVGRRVTDSHAGHSGFILFLDDGTWVASFLEERRLKWQTGAGQPSGEVLSLLCSPEYGDARAPIPQDIPYASQYCDIAAEVAKAHGETIATLAFGRDTFNYVFPDGHELDTRVVTTSDGKPALRVWWEQW
jgi:hypothetical protein